MKKTNGFSMIEVSITAAVLSVAALATGSMVSFSSRTNKSLGLGTEWVTTINLITMALREQTVCEQILNGMTFDPTQLPASVGGGTTRQPLAALTVGGSPLARVGVATDYGLVFTSIEIDRAIATIGPGMIGAIPTTAWLLNIHVKAEKRINVGNGGSNTPTLLNEDFPIYVAFDATNTIVSCGYQEGDVSRVCGDLGGTYNAVATPKCALPAPPSPPPASAYCSQFGGTWNGSACTDLPITQFANLCTSMGGAWTGTACGFTSSTQPIDQICAGLGGTWNGTSCTNLGTSSVSMSGVCGGLGGAWNGTSCTFGTGTGTLSQSELAQACTSFGGTLNTSNQCIVSPSCRTLLSIGDCTGGYSGGPFATTCTTSEYISNIDFRFRHFSGGDYDSMCLNRVVCCRRGP